MGARFVEEVLSRCAELKDVRFYAIFDRKCTDGTLDLLKEYARTESRLKVIFAPENRCVVDAYVRGYREALAGGHDYVLEIDAGYSHLPGDIPKFLDAMEEGYDCVFGSRFMEGGEERDTPIRRQIVSRGGSILTNLLVGTQLKDMTSGFELFSRAALEMVLERGIHSRAHFFQTEIKFYCRKLNVVEVPIVYTTDSVSVNSGVLGDAFRNLWRITKLRWKESLSPRMTPRPALVVTSIASPNPVLRTLASGSIENGYQFYVIGDVCSPPDFTLEGCRFLNISEQRKTGFRVASLCPTRHYARKNIGYLLAIQSGATSLIETDDDNFPLSEFWTHRPVLQDGAAECAAVGWVNVYRYFTDLSIWPRGLPLDAIHQRPPELTAPVETRCPIQQGLADGNPDVDAFYRIGDCGRGVQIRKAPPGCARARSLVSLQ